MSYLFYGIIAAVVVLVIAAWRAPSQEEWDERLPPRDKD